MPHDKTLVVTLGNKKKGGTEEVDIFPTTLFCGRVGEKFCDPLLGIKEKKCFSALNWFPILYIWCFSQLSRSPHQTLAPKRSTLMLMNAPLPSATLTAAEPIKRAYEYLNQVRAQLLHNREVYDRFIEVMGRFKEQR